MTAAAVAGHAEVADAAGVCGSSSTGCGSGSTRSRTGSSTGSGACRRPGPRRPPGRSRRPGSHPRSRSTAVGGEAGGERREVDLEGGPDEGRGGEVGGGRHARRAPRRPWPRAPPARRRRGGAAPGPRARARDVRAAPRPGRRATSRQAGPRAWEVARSGAAAGEPGASAAAGGSAGQRARAWASATSARASRNSPMGLPGDELPEASRPAGEELGRARQLQIDDLARQAGRLEAHQSLPPVICAEPGRVVVAGPGLRHRSPDHGADGAPGPVGRVPVDADADEHHEGGDGVEQARDPAERAPGRSSRTRAATW